MSDEAAAGGSSATSCVGSCNILLDRAAAARLFAGFTYMLSGNYWISVFPGIALLLAIVSINLVADRLRDVLNPRLWQ